MGERIVLRDFLPMRPYKPYHRLLLRHCVLVKKRATDRHLPYLAD